MSRCAIIDLGTNTFNLLIAELPGNKEYRIIYKEELPVKLGEGGIIKKIIAPVPFARGLEALEKYKATIESYGAEMIKAYATSAIRSTTNGNEFVEKAFEETGIFISVITGDEEASFIYKGVKLAGLLLAKPALIMDIGGGSTEFIIADEKSILWKHSFDLGVSRLLQEFNPSDPVSEEQVNILFNWFDIKLVPLFTELKNYDITTLIGCSGSFESFASMIIHKSGVHEAPEPEISVGIHIAEFSELHEILIKSCEAERYTMKGLVAMRVDTIVYAAIIVKYIIDKLKIQEMACSYYALKEGALYDFTYGTN